METTLVAYSEIALKSSNVRRRLERLLARQIECHLRMRGFQNSRAHRRFGRIYVEGIKAEQARIVANIFGVASVMPAIRTWAVLESILGLAVKVASNRIPDGNSFAVRPRVVGDHPFSSQDLAVEAGSRIIEVNSGRGVHVNLSEPDVTVYIEVRDRDAFVYTEIIKGVLGLPYGSQGRLISLFSGGIDSPVATWLMMKRGAEVLPLLMDQRPHVGDSYIERAERACTAIGEYVPSKKYGLYEAPIGDVMSRIMETPVPKLRCVLCKRSMYRIASIFGKERDAMGVVTGESLGQVASQTLDNLYVLDEASELPVLRPNIGLDKVEIEDLARGIGTYDLTARKVDGCTVVPDRPSTRARLKQVLELEEELGLSELCREAAERIQLIEL